MATPKELQQVVDTQTAQDLGVVVNVEASAVKDKALNRVPTISVEFVSAEVSRVHSFDGKHLGTITKTKDGATFLPTLYEFLSKQQVEEILSVMDRA